MRLRRRDIDLLELEGLARAPANGGLALDGLSNSVRHGGCKVREKGGAQEDVVSLESSASA